MSRLFSLLTGINTYHPSSGVPTLHGCHNDIRGWQSFLEAHFPKERHHSVALLDGDATYQNVVHHFGEAFLGRAQAGDTVLFVYSGHGSREGAAQEFDGYYPEGKQETLVLYDSRKSGGLDLADKELAVLIERIALKGANVVVVLDCCHSGSGTRMLEDFTLGAARQHTGREDRRPLDSYLNGAFLNRNDGKGFYLPNSRHMLMAACDRTEKAYELTTRQGLFSTCLLQVLEDTGGRLSYADLFTRCRIAQSKVTDRQHPQFEPYGFFNGYEGFLGLGGASQGTPLRVYFEKNTWQASMGAVHGLPVASGNPAQFEVLKDGEVLGLVGTKVVGMESSSLEQPAFKLHPGETYEAKLRSLPTPKVLYGLQGPEEQTTAAKRALEAFKPVYFDLLENAPTAAYWMEISEEKVQLFRRVDGAMLRTIEGNDWDAMFQDAFETLEHIARWEMMQALDNKSSKINRSDVELLLVEMDDQGKALRTTSKNELVIDILSMDGVVQKVPFHLEVRNKNESKLRHCALFHISENYAFSPVGFNEPVQGGSTAIAMERNSKGVQYAFELRGKNEETETFKLFVSNTKLSGEALQQKGFKLGETVPLWKTKNAKRGGLRLSNAKAVFGLEDEEVVEDINDWYTITLRVKCVARQAEIGAKALPIAGGFIQVSPHSTFRAGVAVGSANGLGRSIEPMSIVAELAHHAGVELLHFGEQTKDLAPVNLLELTDMENETSLEADPLQIELNANLNDNEFLLPVTFDGENLLPIGEVERLEDGKAIVSISHVPEIIDKRRRSLGKALKLCFFKLVLKRDSVNQLCWVDYQGDNIERRSENLRNKVLAANKILLLTHGIIGDTKDMARSMKQTQDNGRFDLILTYDYENLNTKIEDNAAKLKELLEAAGITSESGKKITIVSHSMGGLVSRYFIENLNGKAVVKHLVMAGTPNGGSAISELTAHRDLAIVLLGLLMLTPWNIPVAASVLAILEKSKTLTPSLEQMSLKHNSFLRSLNQSGDPDVKYSIVAGKLHEYLANRQDDQKLMDKLYKLGAKLFYGNTPNDIAVSVESIKAVPMDRNPVPNSVEVACHHLCYFEEEESVKVISETLKE